MVPGYCPVLQAGLAGQRDRTQTEGTEGTLQRGNGADSETQVNDTPPAHTRTARPPFKPISVPSSCEKICFSKTRMRMLSVTKKNILGKRNAFL